MSNEEPNRRIERSVASWWPNRETLEKSGTRRAERAELRRCSSISSVFFCPGYQRLRRRLIDDDHWSARDGFEERVAVVAAILSHVDEDTHSDQSYYTGEFARALASPSTDGASARMSGLRFRRLLDTLEDDDLMIQMIRAVRLMNRRAPVESLACDLLRWGDDGDVIRRRWATRYYETAPSED